MPVPGTPVRRAETPWDRTPTEIVGLLGCLPRTVETLQSSGGWSMGIGVCPEQCCYAHPPVGILSEFMAGSRVRAAI